MRDKALQQRHDRVRQAVEQIRVAGGPAHLLGRLISVSRDSKTVAYCYDRFGRPTRDGDLGFAYDANGNRTAITYPSGAVATYT